MSAQPILIPTICIRPGTQVGAICGTFHANQQVYLPGTHSLPIPHAMRAGELDHGTRPVALEPTVPRAVALTPTVVKGP